MGTHFHFVWGGTIHALKGHGMTAQGNALGWIKIEAPTP